MPSLKSLLVLSGSSIIVTPSGAFPIAKSSNEAGVINGYIAMCPEPAFSEGCKTLSWISQQCNKVPESLNTEVQPATQLKDISRGTCFLYHEGDCAGEQTFIPASPGVDNFEASGLHSPFRSWMCTCGHDCLVMTSDGRK